MSLREKSYRILENSWVYNLSQLILAPGNEFLHNRRLAPVFAGVRGVVLDVGCGPKLSTPAPDGIVVGVDLNPAYVKSYTGGVIDTDPSRIVAASPVKRFGFVASADQMPFKDGTFDEARCRFMLHHLPDDLAVKVIKEMYRCVRPGGRILVMDGIWPKSFWHNPIAWGIRRLDRGEFMRTDEQLRSIASHACEGEWSADRYTYTFNGLELVVLQHFKARS